MRFSIILGIGLISLNLAHPQITYAADHPYQLSLGVETPVGMSPQKFSEDSPATVWNCKILAIEKISVFTEGKINWKSGTPWDSENKMKFGLERPIGYNLHLYGYYERRFDLDVNRFVVGCKWTFGGKL